MSTEPTHLANKVIKQMVEHLFGDLPEPQFEDYMAIRAVFRRLGGSWAALGQGDNKQIDTLSRVVIAWGQMPGRKTREEKVI